MPDLTATKFTDDDPGYLAWVAAHPAGFVVNTYRQPTRHVILHRATCYSVQGRTSRGTFTGGSTAKVCGTRQAVNAWARQLFGTTEVFATCARCGT